MCRWRERAALTAALFLALSPAIGRAEPVAVTFDDLPTLELGDDPRYAAVSTARLIRALRHERIPATGFVVGEKFEPDAAFRRALLRAWLSAGFELGNHTYSHASLSTTPPSAYEADIARNHALIRTLSLRRKRGPLWFRHPYLETGACPEDKSQVEAWLSAHGYRIAPVTLENSDYAFALAYDEAVQAGDKTSAAKIRSRYLGYTERVVRWYREAALGLLGRRPALILLLHASRLNADTLSSLATILRRNALQPVTLRAAMRDPAYGLPDGFDPDGDEWLSRWSKVLGRDLPWASYPEPPVDIMAANERLDTAP